jgi:S1-C subfamily serine protease
VAKQIESGQSDSTSSASSHGYLGVEVSDSDSGATVSGTVDGSPAAGAGVAAGDVITSVNGQSVDSASALSALLANSHVGDRVRLGWLDQDGSSNSATVTLMAGSG